MTLREKLGKPVLFHWVGWHGKTLPSRSGYDSRNAAVIGDQLTAMQKLGGDGFGVIALTYGPTADSFIHAAVMEMSRQCNDRNVPFALCFDPWTVRNAVDKNAAMITALHHVDIQMMMSGRSYLLYKGRRVVLDFNTGVDLAKIIAAVPDMTYWLRGVNYTWPSRDNTMSVLAQQSRFTTMSLPCLFRYFNDGNVTDRNKQAWDLTKPVTVIEALAGTTYQASVAIGQSVKGDYYQYVTWNDVDEGTEIESVAGML